MNKVVGVIALDKGLIELLGRIEQFSKIIELDDIEDAEEKSEELDVLIISEEMVSINDLIGHISINQEDKIVKDIDQVFYRQLEFKADIRELLEMHGIDQIPIRMSNKDIVDYLFKKVIGKVYTKNNIVVFHGTDHKVGTTMITQSVAEQLAKDQSIKVLLLFMSGYPEDDYLKLDDLVSFDELKNKIFTKVITSTDISEICAKPKENLHIIKGVENYLDRRYYEINAINDFIELASKNYNVVLIDTGSEIELPMTISALNTTNNRYLVATQEPTTINRYKMLKDQVYKRHGFDDFLLITNKYIKNDRMVTPNKLADELGLTSHYTVGNLEYGLQCEIEKRSLLSLDVKEYEEDIKNIVNHISMRLSVDYRETKLTMFQKLLRTLGVKPKLNEA